MKDVPGQMDLWEGGKNKEGKIIRIPNYDTDLNVAFSAFKESKYMSVDEIFDGFDDLKVVTYSYDLDFIEQISEKFETMTVLLGCEKIVRGDVVPLILASQKYSIESIKKHKKLYERALDGSVVFKVAKEVTSHQKLYILTAKNGETRTLTGSANFSRRGFSGLSVQGEYYDCYENDFDGTKFVRSHFDFLNDNCMDEVTHDTLCISRTDDMEIKDLPIAQEVAISGAGIILEPGFSLEEVEYITDVSKIAARFTDLTKEVRIKIDESSDKILLVPEYIRELNKIEKKRNAEEKEVERRFPKLHIDYDAETVSFGGEPYDLDNVKIEDVRSDILTLLEYFRGFDDFIGDTRQTKETYWRMMNFMFLSPFMAMLRDVAHRNDFAEECFPYYAVLSGKKSAGKTQFVLLIQYLMTGMAIEKAPDGTWTKRSMRASLSEIEGIPVCIDDIQNAAFQRNVGDIVKCDDWLFTEKITHHSSYVLTTNEITTIKPEWSKRIYFAPISATQTNFEAVSRKKKLMALRRRFTTAFYRRYLREMLPVVNDMIREMETTDDLSWMPDIFAASSEAILSLFNESGIKVPDYMEPLVYNDYFGYNNLSKDIQSLIRDEWVHNKGAFKVLKKKNELEYLAGEKKYEANNIINALPEVLEARRSGLKVIMKLDEAEKFFGISFRKGLFS